MHVYVHIPFCLKKCAYCDFASTGLDAFSGRPPLDEYFRALTAEIESRAPLMDDTSVSTIYFGGGTPGAGGIENLLKTLDLLKNIFTLEPGCEITVETNPKTFGASDYKRLVFGGFNRISIGVQSLNDEVLKRLGRVHDSLEAETASKEARGAGFGNVSVDFMIGVPYEKGRSAVKTDFSGLGRLGAGHVSVYQFSVCEGTPIASRVRRGELIALTDEEMAAEYTLACSSLEKAGFAQYEISNFASSAEFISRHNYSYWLKHDYAGFGAGAVSTIKNARQSNCREISDYINGIKTGRYFETEILGPGEQRLEKIMLALRTAEGLAAEELAEGGCEILLKSPIIKRLADDGYAFLRGGRLSLSVKGFLVMNKIALTVAEILPAAEQH
ncbi:MAG: hypothetical protein A2008_12845 [Candidatus Wallbacteria bacterium GWC2_49_35]|uniref:Heme chaperone HemW n=1 Tax=Candidatus Wallbacteria bacterium GWC2_49_35 TaxID=1817813 RepID=A0A1F7WGW4_9BACT|nr:MAG: hypothetical protein A2008_12845 [Candidatus Wallbacteria bacterium GWC2_49_35]HBC75759.1 hypothetical protein [Candidatus Wallbacteria bacterium]